MIYKKVLEHDTVEFDRYFKIINSKAPPSINKITPNHNQTNPTRPIFQNHQSRNPEQLPVTPMPGGDDRDFPDPQVTIQNNIRVKPSKDPRSKPIKIASVTEDKHEKRSPARHAIRTILTKYLKHRGKSSQ